MEVAGLNIMQIYCIKTESDHLPVLFGFFFEEAVVALQRYGQRSILNTKRASVWETDSGIECERWFRLKLEHKANGGDMITRVSVSTERQCLEHNVHLIGRKVGNHSEDLLRQSGRLIKAEIFSVFHIRGSGQLEQPMHGRGTHRVSR